MFGSSNPFDSSDGIDGTLAERENHVVACPRVCRQLDKGYADGIFSCPSDICSSLLSFRSSKENATLGSGHCNITMIGGGCDPSSILLLSAGGTHGGFGFHLHAISYRNWRRIRNGPC